jgi:hypothetical protein
MTLSLVQKIDTKITPLIDTYGYLVVCVYHVVLPYTVEAKLKS